MLHKRDNKYNLARRLGWVKGQLEVLDASQIDTIIPCIFFSILYYIIKFELT